MLLSVSNTHANVNTRQHSHWVEWRVSNSQEMDILGFDKELTEVEMMTNIFESEQVE